MSPRASTHSLPATRCIDGGNSATKPVHLIAAIKYLAPFLLSSLLVCWNTLYAESVAVHYQEGVTHGFLVLQSLAGQILAAGDFIQSANGNQVTSETVFHFKDGSVHDEITVFSQDHTFRLISDHLIQKGPSFPHPIDILIDATKNEVTIHASEKGKEKDETQHLDLPEDLANGMLSPLLRNISASTPETKVSWLATSPKPRLVKLSITSKGERTFTVAESTRKATNFNLHVEIGGVAGVIAPVLGKQPPDTQVWMSAGNDPTFVRSEGPLYEGGPIWRIDLAPPHMSHYGQDAKAANKQSTRKK